MDKTIGRTLIVGIIAAILLAVPVGATRAQDGDDSDTETEEDLLDTPLPYDPAEFPAWSRDLRRAEIVALGSFPITMILSGLTYQLGRFAYHSVQAGAPDSDYAPWFFSTSTGERYDSNERIGLIISAASLSVGVAVLDYVLGRREHNRSTE